MTAVVFYFLRWFVKCGPVVGERKLNSHKNINFVLKITTVNNICLLVDSVFLQETLERVPSGHKITVGRGNGYP